MFQKEEFSLTQAGDASFGINISGNLNKRTEGWDIRIQFPNK